MKEGLLGWLIHTRLLSERCLVSFAGMRVLLTPDRCSGPDGLRSGPASQAPHTYMADRNDGAAWHGVSGPCRSDRRRCSSLLRMSSGAMSGHDLPRQEACAASSWAAQSDAGTARPCPPRSQGLAAPTSDTDFGARVASSCGSTPVGARPRSTSLPERDRGVGTLAGGPHAPSRSCPRTPHEAP